MLREVEIRNSSPPLSKPHLPQNSEVQPFPLPVHCLSRHSSGRKVGPFCGTMGRIDRQQVGPLYHLKWVQDPIKVSSSPIGCSDISSSPLLQNEIAQLLKKRAVERVRNLATLGFYSRLFLVPKKNGKLRPVKDLSLLNRYINRQHFKMETVKSVRQ